MSRRMSRPATITVTAVTPTGQSVTILRNAAGIHTGPTALGDINVRWSRPTALADADPAQATITLTQPAAAPPITLPLASKLTIRAAVDGITATIIDAFVTAWSRTVRAGRATYSIDTTDIIGRMAGTMLASTPWPSETINARARRLNQFLGEPILDIANTQLYPDGYTIPRLDVDNAPALDVIRRTARYDIPLHAKRDKISGHANGGYIIAGGTLYTNRADDTAGVITIPSNAIVDSGATLTRRGRINRIRVTQPSTMTGDTTESHVVESIGPDRTVSQHSYEAGFPSAFPTPGDNTHRLWRTITKEASTPRIMLEPTRLLLNRLPADTIRQLLDGDRRPGLVVYIDGPLTTPLDRAQLVLGVDITIRGGEITTLIVTLIPSATAGLVSLTWRHITPQSSFQNHDSRQPSATWRHTRTAYYYSQA